MFSSKEVYYNELRRCVEDAIAEAKIIDDNISEVSDQESLALVKGIRDFLLMTYPLCYAYVVMVIEALPRLQQKECEKWLNKGSAAPIVSTYKLRRSEIFDVLLLFRPELRESLVRCVSAPARIQDDLLDALDEANKEAFLSILESPECDYSLLASTLYDERAMFKQWQLFTSIHSVITGEDGGEENYALAAKAVMEEPKYGEAAFAAQNKIESIEDLIVFADSWLSLIIALYKCAELFATEASILKPIFESEDYMSFCEKHKNDIDAYYCLLQSGQDVDFGKLLYAPLVDEQDGMVSTTETPLLQESSQADGGVGKNEAGTPDARVSAEGAEKPRNKGGRKRDIWYKGDYSEEEVQSKLEAVWKGIELYMDELVYYHHSGGKLNEVKQGPAREQAKKALGAALILSATNEAGLAKESNSTCKESIGRLFLFLAGRNSIQPYFEVVNSILVKAMNQGKTEISPRFIDKHSIDCKNATPLHKLVLKTNYLNLYILYNNSVYYICEFFKLETYRKYIEWQAPEDKALSRSKEYKEGYGADSSDD